MRSSLLLAIFISVFLVFQAAADQVTLKNGDRMSGTIMKSDGKALVLHTDYAGDITLKFEAISAIQSDAQLHIELQDGKTVAGAVTTSDSKLEIATKAAGTVEAPISAVKTLRNDAEQTAYDKTLHPGLMQGWKTGLNVGFALTGGNSETTNLSLAFLGARQTLRDKLVSMEEEDLRVRDELAADGSLSDGYHPRMEEVHRRNAARLREIIDSINNRQLLHRHCHDWKTARERKLCPTRYI